MKKPKVGTTVMLITIFILGLLLIWTQVKNEYVGKPNHIDESSKKNDSGKLDINMKQIDSSPKTQYLNQNGESEKIADSISDYYEGIRLFEEANYWEAIKRFGDVPDGDSNFLKAQEFIRIIENKEQSSTEANFQRELKEKYETLFDRGSSLSRNKEILKRQNFNLYRLDYEDTPDGPKEVSWYYKKLERGYYVHIHFQYQFGRRNSTASVWVEK